MVEVQLYQAKLSERLPVSRRARTVQPFRVCGPRKVALGYSSDKRGNEVRVFATLLAPAACVRLVYNHHCLALRASVLVGWP